MLVGMYPDTSTLFLLPVFYLYLSDELSLFQLIFIVRSYVVLLHHFPKGGIGSRHILYVCARPRSGAYNSVAVFFFAVPHICYFFGTKIRLLVFSFQLFNIFLLKTFYS